MQIISSDIDDGTLSFTDHAAVTATLNVSPIRNKKRKKNSVRLDIKNNNAKQAILHAMQYTLQSDGYRSEDSDTSRVEGPRVCFADERVIPPDGVSNNAMAVDVDDSDDDDDTFPWGSIEIDGKLTPAPAPWYRQKLDDSIAYTHVQEEKEKLLSDIKNNIHYHEVHAFLNALEETNITSELKETLIQRLMTTPAIMQMMSSIPDAQQEFFEIEGEERATDETTPVSLNATSVDAEKIIAEYNKGHINE